MNNMPRVLNIQGKAELIFDPEQFAALLDEQLGPDAAEYFRMCVQSTQDAALAELRRDPSRYCTGECDKLYKQQEAYENQLSDVREELQALRNHIVKMSCKHPHTNYGLGMCERAIELCDV